jgi:hypothetical protein
MSDDNQIRRDAACATECEWGDTQLCAIYSKCLKLAFREAVHNELMVRAKAFLDNA